MAWERTRMWHWMILAVVAGWSIGGWRAGQVELQIKEMGESLNGQKQFEEALFKKIEQHWQFENLIVTPEAIDDGTGTRRSVHVIRGDFWDGRREAHDAGSPVARWRPAFFVAEVPYKPAIDLVRLQDTVPDAAAVFAAIKNPTVIDFLKLAGRARGVTYQNHWWAGSAHARWIWLVCCVVVIGLGMPLAINLTVFGTVLRPKMPAEVGMDLSNVVPKPTPALSDEEIAARARELEALDRQLQKQLSSHSEAAERSAAGTSAPVGAAVKVKAAPVKLSNAPVTPATALTAAESKEFKAKRDDFYPTERHSKK